ncbi:MAG: MATE family efflux transporter [Planctomycetia bacterium]|nr:MATE family efflux transporter [Planctomycetia bacterium]
MVPPDVSPAAAVHGAAGTLRPLVRLVVPVLLEQVLALAVGFVDKWIAGNLFTGAEPLAAVGLVAYCLAFIPVAFTLPAVAATALVARRVGAGDMQGARRAMAQSFLVASVLTLAVMLLIGLEGGRIVSLLGLPDESSRLAARYLGIVMPALPAMMVIAIGIASLRGAGDMVAGLAAMSVVNVVNAAASFALGAGLGGLPRLGWDGLAWGTLAGYCCGAVCVIALLSRRRRGLRPLLGDWWPNAAWLRRIARVGLPAGVDAAANAACHLTFLSIVNRMGNVDAAAHAVAVTIESLAFLPGSAFQVAAATLAGQFLGARDERRARGSVWLAALACVSLMTAAGAAFFWFAEPLAGWFVGGSTAGSPVAGLAASLVRIVAFAQPPLALLMVLSGGLRGGGATRPPMLVNFLGLVAIRLPLAMFLAWDVVPLPIGLGSVRGLGLGVCGAWLAMATDLTARGVAMLAIFARPGWTRVRV